MTVDLATHDIWLCPGLSECNQIRRPHLHTMPTGAGPGTLMPNVPVMQIQADDQLVGLANAVVTCSEPASDYWWLIHFWIGDPGHTTNVLLPNDTLLTVLRPCYEAAGPAWWA